MANERSNLIMPVTINQYLLWWYSMEWTLHKFTKQYGQHCVGDVFRYIFFYDNNYFFNQNFHDDIIKWKLFPRYWPFVQGIHRSTVNSPHKGQWRGALMFSLICVWINGWVNNREAGDLRRHGAHYDVIVMYWSLFPGLVLNRWIRYIKHDIFSFHEHMPFESPLQLVMILKC